MKQEYYDNGQVMRETVCVDEHITVEREYHKDGTLVSESPRKNGLLHGLTKEWYSDGPLYFETPYCNGLIHGVRKGWFHNGQLAFSISYLDGRMHGVAGWWYKNGILNVKRYYLYCEDVSEEEYKKHILVEKLACLK